MKRILTFIMLISIAGCATDFDVIAPYKEVMVIDGLLNTWDSIQYIRVSKAFLGEGNAVVMAQQKDSINYGDILSVKLTELSSGSQFNLIREELNNKDSGVFAYPYVVLFKTNHHIDPASKYKLEVVNTVSGLTATSETKVVGDIRINPPIQDPIDLASSFNAPSYVSYEPGKNSYVHELRIRFHYREIDPAGVSTMHVVDWNLGSPTTSTSQEVKYVFYKADFFTNLFNNIPDKPGYTRRVDSLDAGVKTVEYVFVEGSEDLQTYIQLNKPSTGVVTDKPLFTTIQNGIGLFSSRLIRSEYRDINLATKTFMDTSAYTRTKNFEF